MNPTLYDILGVAPDASATEIKRAWRDAAERFEPGSGGSPAQFRLFNEAAETLLDPVRRREYDAALTPPAADRTVSAPDAPDAPAATAAAATPGAGGGAVTTTLPDAGAPEDGPEDGPDDGPEDGPDDGPEDGSGADGAAPGSVISRWTGRLRRRRAPGARSTVAPTDAPGAARDADGPAGAEPEADVETQPDASQPRPPVRWPVLTALAVVALLLVGLAAGPFVPGLGLQAVREVAAQDALDEARRAAPAAAERAAEAILAYDYRSLEADRDAAARFMTPDYRKEYLETFDKTILDAAPQLKARVTADVRASGVSLATEDRVEVLLFVNQTTVSTANSGEEQRALNRVMFTMERSDGTWLVDDITSY